jgi:hypothetical protein
MIDPLKYTPSMHAMNRDFCNRIAPVVRGGIQVSYAVDAGMDVDITLCIVRIPSNSVTARGTRYETAVLGVRLASCIVGRRIDHGLPLFRNPDTLNGKKAIVKKIFIFFIFYLL